jgi:hypothetical protein
MIQAESDAQHILRSKQKFFLFFFWERKTDLREMMVNKWSESSRTRSKLRLIHLLNKLKMVKSN